MEKKYEDLNESPNLKEIKEEVFKARSEKIINESFREKKIRTPFKSIKEYIEAKNLAEIEYDEESFLKLRQTIKVLRKKVGLEKKQQSQILNFRRKMFEEMKQENFEMAMKLKEKEKVLIFAIFFLIKKK